MGIFKNSYHFEMVELIILFKLDLQSMNSIVCCFNIGLGRNPLKTAEVANKSNSPHFETLKSITFKLTLNNSIAYINLFTDYFIKLGRSSVI